MVQHHIAAKRFQTDVQYSKIVRRDFTESLHITPRKMILKYHVTDSSETGYLERKTEITSQNGHIVPVTKAKEANNVDFILKGGSKPAPIKDLKMMCIHKIKFLLG